MGCFLACFGFKPKKKGRKSRNISSSAEQNHGRYLPLDSDVCTKFDTTEKHNALDSGIKEKAKEESRSRIKKKVRFNLNVVAYEPIHNEEDINIYVSDNEEEETRWEFNTETTSLMGTLHYAQDPISYPQNHRYHNCSTDEIYEDVGGDYELDNDMSSDEDYKEDKSNDCENDEEKSGHNLGLKNEEIKGIGSDLYAKDRKSKHLLSVLSPVENLSQWKAVKARSAPLRPREKENVALDEYQQSTPSCRLKLEDQCLKSSKSPKVLRVDASLSNWLSLT
ncbi:transcription initiation factor TFIID subunit 7-like [Dorcoceras hygrometricum]|uniref:Transcription initiation factor TFIID subunit 7-like n=1 Tax=Dorcoceras hygrometricum TaxID=472368 RepID=A0A2Z7CAM2_9LAMI|nr:transcription initiation factor TFIID subunit 7-like [Dorcoceras hygrometricum]